SLTGSTPSNGSFNWTIPFNFTGGSDYSIRIASVQNSSVVFDNSDSNFTIIFNGIIVTSPNGGEIWEAGTRNTITWTDVINEAVQIDLYKSNTLYSPISPSTTSDGAFSWNIPTQTEAGSDYKIMMKSTINDNIFDISDNSFSIIGSEITVISPNGFENWMMGSTQEIIWSSTNVENVKIELSLTEGMSWETIVDSISNIGFYSWVINTSMPSFYCLIRISDIIDENIFDISDDVFIIDIFTSVEDYFGNGIPTEYNLIQNFPNPFNPSTTIYYGLPEESAVKINIYGVLGNEVMVYSEDKQEAGYHRVEFDASGLPSGIYFYRMQAGKFIETKKMILLK
ncbi:MAG: T9SS type A sorting domain-containing protein, partial [Bacteroidetes bacterium]|nr:T9SS type A sorting domain-containing protein [Bacteroidota bacterium]